MPLLHSSMQQHASAAKQPDTAPTADKRRAESLQHEQKQPSKRVCAHQPACAASTAAGSCDQQMLQQPQQQQGYHPGSSDHYNAAHDPSSYPHQQQQQQQQESQQQSEQGAAAAPAQQQRVTRIALTVNRAGAANSKLLAALGQWVAACGIVRDPGSTLVTSLLPHHARLLSHLDNLYSTKQLTPQTVTTYLHVLYRFLVQQRKTLEDTSVDYAAMLSSIRATYTRLSWGWVGVSQSRAGTNSTATGSAAAATPAARAAAAAAVANGGAACGGCSDGSRPKDAASAAATAADTSTGACNAAANASAGNEILPGSCPAAARALSSAVSSGGEQVAAACRQATGPMTGLRLQQQQPQQEPVASVQAVVGAAGPAAQGLVHMSAQQQQQQPGMQPAAFSAVAVVGSQSREVAAAAATVVAARPAQLQGAASSWTVQGVGATGSAGNLQRALRRWVQACAIASDPGSVRVAELLPHYARLLCMLEAQYSSKQLAAQTIYNCLLALCNFLRDHQQALQSSSVGYVAMLSSMEAAQRRYCKLKAQHKQGKATVGCRQGAAAAAAAVAAAGATASAGLVCYAAPVLLTASAAAAAGGTAEAASIAQLDQQQLGGGHTDGGNSRPLSEPGPAAVAALPAEHGTPASNMLFVFGHSISMAALLQQLQSNPSLGAGCEGAFVRLLGDSAASFEGVGLTAIPASLLLANYIAEVGDRAQQCVSAGAVGHPDNEVRSNCLAIGEEVEGLLRLSGQPVLLQLLGGQGLQELVEGLMRCKQQLTETHLRWCKQLLSET